MSNFLVFEFAHHVLMWVLFSLFLGCFQDISTIKIHCSKKKDGGSQSKTSAAPEI